MRGCTTWCARASYAYRYGFLLITSWT